VKQACHQARCALHVPATGASEPSDLLRAPDAGPGHPPQPAQRHGASCPCRGAAAAAAQQRRGEDHRPGLDEHGCGQARSPGAGSPSPDQLEPSDGQEHGEHIEPEVGAGKRAQPEHKPCRRRAAPPAEGQHTGDGQVGTQHRQHHAVLRGRGAPPGQHLDHRQGPRRVLDLSVPVRHTPAFGDLLEPGRIPSPQLRGLVGPGAQDEEPGHRQADGHQHADRRHPALQPHGRIFPPSCLRPWPSGGPIAEHSPGHHLDGSRGSPGAPTLDPCPHPPDAGPDVWPSEQEGCWWSRAAAWSTPGARAG
jgi:hypothetical protein